MGSLIWQRAQFPTSTDSSAWRPIHFSCQKIPAEIALQPPNQWQRYYSYLMYAIGFVWKVAGISLPVIWAFYGVVFAATLCAPIRIDAASGPGRFSPWSC